jgi:preprotein translocase subunit SecA
MKECDKELFFIIDEKNNSIDLTEKGIEMITGGGEDKEFFVLPDVGSEVARMIEKMAVSEEEKFNLKDECHEKFCCKKRTCSFNSAIIKSICTF